MSRQSKASNTGVHVRVENKVRSEGERPVEGRFRCWWRVVKPLSGWQRRRGLSLAKQVTAAPVAPASAEGPLAESTLEELPALQAQQASDAVAGQNAQQQGELVQEPSSSAAALELAEAGVELGVFAEYEYDGRRLFRLPLQRAEEQVFGRRTMALPDPAVSRRHVKLCWTGAEVLIHDLDSTSGTGFRGREVHSARVPIGESISLARRSQLHFVSAPLSSSCSCLDVSRELWVDAPLRLGGVQVFPIRGKDLEMPVMPESLAEAMQGGRLVVKETGTVANLRYRNNGKKPVLGVLGELLMGGRQDRALKRDVWMPAGAEGDLAVVCVEQNRWAPMAGEPAGEFRHGVTVVASLTRAVLATSRSQRDVWATVSETLPRLLGSEQRRGNSSYARGVSSSAFVKQSRSYRSELLQFKLAEDTLGHVVCDGPWVLSAEYFHGAAYYAQQWPRLVNSIAAECMQSSESTEPLASSASVALWMRDWLERHHVPALQGLDVELPSPLHVLMTPESYALPPR
ncbi:MAG: FHA domain-containing protein [Myxococcota bacterium]|jgi:hypothetical protein|nr:FHA domain-containing protein [Myxococcota bacterium]